MSYLNKRFLSVFTVALLLLVSPCARAHADVLMNEVAWMGTTSSQYEEWIELYNNGSADIDLNGWKILKRDGSTTLYNLSQPISAGGYLLICRTTATLTNPLDGSCNEKGPFGGSGLSNTGEHL